MSVQEVFTFGRSGAQFEVHTTKQERLGQLLLLPDGRKFRYCYAGAAMNAHARGQVNGQICPGSSGNVAGYEGVLSAAALVGDPTVTVPDTTVRVKDYYEGGYMFVYDTVTPHYANYQIRGNAGPTDGATVTLDLEAPLHSPIGASHQVTVYRSPYSSVVGPSTVTATYEAFVGVAVTPVAASRWFWIQTAGPCMLACHGGTWPGSAADSRDVFFYKDGTCDPASVATPASGFQRAGYLLSATASGYGDIYIMLQME